MEEQGEHREIRTSAPEGEKKARWRRPVIATGVSALVTALVCGGGLALAGRGGDSAPEARAAVSPLPIPMIMSVDDLEGVDPQDLSGSLERSTARLAEAVRAGEQVYEAARPTAAPRALERLRGALDEATAALEEEPARDATAKQRTKRLRTLDGLRTKILDAAARITAVRTVPGSELPPGTTTAVVAPDDAVVPTEDGGGGPAGEESGGDTVSADGSDGSDTGGSTGSGDSGGSDSGGSGTGGSGDGGSGGGGLGDDGDDDPVVPPPPTRSPTPAPSPPPSSPAPAPSPSPSGSA